MKNSVFLLLILTTMPLFCEQQRNRATEEVPEKKVSNKKNLIAAGLLLGSFALFLVSLNEFVKKNKRKKMDDFAELLTAFKDHKRYSWALNNLIDKKTKLILNHIQRMRSNKDINQTEREFLEQLNKLEIACNELWENLYYCEKIIDRAGTRGFAYEDLKSFNSSQMEDMKLTSMVLEKYKQASADWYVELQKKRLKQDEELKNLKLELSRAKLRKEL